MPPKEKNALDRWQAARDETAFKELYESFYHTLLSLACKYVDDEAARDIVQDTFLKLWNDPGRYTGIGDLRWYMYRMIRNGSLNYLRGKKAESDAHVNMEKSTDDFFFHALLEEEVFAALREAVDRLPEIYRDVLVCALSGLSDKEAAMRLSISVDSVKTRKKRGKSLLRAILDDPALLLLLNLL